MSFRGRLFPLLLVVTGCGLNTGEKAPGPTEVRISGARFSCLTQIAPKVEDYLNAKMRDEDVSSFVSCLQNAFVVFDQTYHGSKRWDSFSPEEIRNYLRKYFLPEDRDISDELLHQFMVIKQTMMGGKIDSITRADLAEAVRVLEQVKVEALRLRPYISILNPNLVVKEKAETLQEKIPAADRAANISIKALAGLLSKSQHPYKFEDLESFLTEFRAFAHWDEHFETHRPAKNWNELLVAFKAATVSPDERAIAPDDWGPLLQSATGWYLNYIKFDVGIRDETLLEGKGFLNFVAWSDKVQALLNQAVESQPNRMVPFSSLDRLIASVKGVGWLPDNIRIESAQSAVRAMINRVLGPEDVDAPDRVSPGLTKVTLANLAAEWSQWEEIQMALQEQFEEAEHRHERLEAYGPQVPLLALPMQISGRSEDRSGWDQFIANFDKYRPLFKEDYNRVFLIEEQLLPTSVPNGFHNLSWMNVYRTALDLVYKGYAPRAEGYRLKGVPMTAGLPQTRLESFYEDFRQIGIDVGFLDSRVTSAGGRTFMEAKIFTYLADGLEGTQPVLTYAQGVQEGAFLFSGGALSDDLYKYLKNFCPQGALDLNGVPKLMRSCVRQRVVEALKDKVKTMPGFSKFLESLKDSQHEMSYADALLNSAQRPYSDKYEVEQSEFATMAMVIHYSEAIMTTYNDDLDDRLSEREINRAVPIFRGLIATLSQKLGHWDPMPENTFKFILAYGHLPKTPADMTEIARHSAWDSVGFHESWGLSLDRTDITRVFAAIVQGMVAPAQKRNADIGPNPFYFPEGLQF